MPENMTDKDIEKLAEAIYKKKPAAFYVEPEEHYLQHEKLERLLDAYDSASNLVVKFVIGAFLVGTVAAVAMGLGWHK